MLKVEINELFASCKFGVWNYEDKVSKATMIVWRHHLIHYPLIYDYKSKDKQNLMLLIFWKWKFKTFIRCTMGFIYGPFSCKHIIPTARIICWVNTLDYVAQLISWGVLKINKSSLKHYRKNHTFMEPYEIEKLLKE